jgi:ATP-dependent helicase/nuclease subunit B
VKKTKDNALGKYSKVASAEDFGTMMEYAETKVEQLHREILEGNVKAMPYRMGEKTGCDYCKYKQICGFDTRIDGYEYKDIHALSDEEAIAAMKKELYAKGE